jgi:hypothetical protein
MEDNVLQILCCNFDITVPKIRKLILNCEKPSGSVVQFNNTQNYEPLMEVHEASADVSNVYFEG